MRLTLAANMLVLASLASFAPEARAERAGDGAAAAEALLVQLEAVPEAKALAKDVIARSRHALDRARKARAASDHRHGTELEALARELAETGRDLVRTVKAERTLGELESKTRELEARAVRARALVEQTVARRGRVAEQLERVQAERAAQSAGSAKAPPPPAPRSAPATVLPPAPAKPAPVAPAPADAAPTKRPPPNTPPKPPAPVPKPGGAP